jgi:hypothetical protein
VSTVYRDEERERRFHLEGNYNGRSGHPDGAAYNKERQRYDVDKWLSFYDSLQSAVFPTLPPPAAPSVVQLDPTETILRMRIRMQPSMRHV